MRPGFLPLALSFVALHSAPLTAQVLFPLNGDYRYASITAEHGSGCGGGGDLLTAENGTATFAAAGTVAIVVSEHVVCEDGTQVTSPNTGTLPYIVDASGVVTVDPGTIDETRLYPSHDLQALVWASNALNQSPSLGIGIRRSTNLASSILSGDYHFTRFSLANPGTGTSAVLYLGSMNFTGTSFTALFGSKMIDPLGGTTFPPSAGAGTFTLAPNGDLTLSGLAGAAVMNGAITPDGNLFFVVDDEGSDVGLLVGLRSATSATASLLSGTWWGGNIDAGFGPFPNPWFCSNTFTATLDGTLSTWSTTELELCEDRVSTTVGTNSGAGTFTVAPAGTTCFLDAGATTCFPGATDPTGTYSFDVDFPSLGEFGFAVFVRMPQPSIAYCLGDGTGTPCPCSNHSPSNELAGCLNSLTLGGRLQTLGAASLTADTLVLAGTQMPNSSALYFQGTTLVAGGLGAPFGDGLRCAGGSVIRLGTKTNSGNASQYPGPGDPPVHVRGLVTGPGTRSYQVWYRNAAAFCTASTFNLTNGRLVIWAP